MALHTHAPLEKRWWGIRLQEAPGLWKMLTQAPAEAARDLLTPETSMLLTQDKMGDDAGKDEGSQEGEREDEGIEVAVVTLPHTVAHPGAVVVKPLWKRRTRTVRTRPQHTRTALSAGEGCVPTILKRKKSPAGSVPCAHSGQSEDTDQPPRPTPDPNPLFLCTIMLNVAADC